MREEDGDVLFRVISYGKEVNEGFGDPHLREPQLLGGEAAGSPYFGMTTTL